MSLIDIINSICIDVDAEQRSQRAELAARARFPLSTEQVLGIERCPDWPEDRVIAYASLRTHWTAADIAEDGLAERIYAGDAVWLLLQPGVLSASVLKTFVLQCADHLLIGCPSTHREAELELRQCAIGLSKNGREQSAQYLMRVSRCAGIAAQFEENKTLSLEERAKYALQASHLAIHSSLHGPRDESRRQCLCLHALVT